MNIHRISTAAAAALFLLTSSAACGPKKAQVDPAAALQAYVADAKAQPRAEPRAEGSLWAGEGRRADLFRDFKARDINDVVTIQVVESTQALSSADAKNSRNSEVQTGFSSVFGLEKKIGELPSLVSGKSSSSFEGQGSTSRTTTLRTTLTARVVDVLPNGYLVVRGVREVRVNNENQAVHITGVVRPEDITSDNVVLSSAVAEMAVHVQGKGFVSQPLKPGWLYRILNGILPF